MEIIPKTTLHYLSGVGAGIFITYLFMFLFLCMNKDNEDSDFWGLLVIKYLFDRYRKVDLCILFSLYPRLIVSEFSFISHIHRCPHTQTYTHSRNTSFLTRHY